MPRQHRFVFVALVAAAALPAACQRQDARPPPKDAAVTRTEANLAPKDVALAGAGRHQLWRIEVMQNGQPSQPLEICADQAIEASFSRPVPTIEGRECVRVDDPTDTGATYSVRCRIDDQLYRVGSVTNGDRAREFTVEMAVSRQDKKGPSFEQVRRYTRVGACPAGWKIGDSAAPGQTQVTNTLSGEKRTIAR